MGSTPWFEARSGIAETISHGEVPMPDNRIRMVWSFARLRILRAVLIEGKAFFQLGLVGLTEIDELQPKELPLTGWLNPEYPAL